MITQRKTIRLALLGALALLAAIALPVAGAQAQTDLAGGKTTLKLDKAVTEVLTDNGVAVTPIAPAKAKGSKVSFPVTGGELSSKLTGEIKHSGGLRIAAGGVKLDAKSFVIELGKKSKLTAKVGKDRLALLKLDASDAKVTQDGFSTKIAGVEAALTSGAAKALNATFGVDLFARGLVLGKTTTVVDPATVKIAGGDTALTLDPGTASALTSLGVTAAPIDPASALPSGALAFPITKGKLDAETLGGKISHSGGISLTAGSTVVELTAFDINIDADPDLSALVGGTRVSILDLNLDGLEVKNEGGVLTLSGVSAALTKDAADALNAAFGVTAFTPGLVLGTTTTTAELG